MIIATLFSGNLEPELRIDIFVFTDYIRVFFLDSPGNCCLGLQITNVLLQQCLGPEVIGIQEQPKWCSVSMCVDV